MSPPVQPTHLTVTNVLPLSETLNFSLSDHPILWVSANCPGIVLLPAGISISLTFVVLPRIFYRIACFLVRDAEDLNASKLDTMSVEQCLTQFWVVTRDVLSFCVGVMCFALGSFLSSVGLSLCLCHFQCLSLCSHSRRTVFGLEISVCVCLSVSVVVVLWCVKCKVW